MWQYESNKQQQRFNDIIFCRLTNISYSCGQVKVDRLNFPFSFSKAKHRWPEKTIPTSTCDLFFRRRNRRCFLVDVIDRHREDATTDASACDGTIVGFKLVGVQAGRRKLKGSERRRRLSSYRVSVERTDQLVSIYFLVICFFHASINAVCSLERINIAVTRCPHSFHRLSWPQEQLCSIYSFVDI